MAARFSQPKEDLCCSICTNIYNNPVVLPCSHSFCKQCLENWWADKPTRLCPLCRKPSAADPPCNLALKNLCESFLLELSLEEKTAAAKSETLCSLHSEKLKLYCLDHQQPICVICRDSRAHANHRFSPIDEAADDCKEELRKHLKPLQEEDEHFREVRADWDLTAKHIEAQADAAEGEIRNTFQKLHKFLEDEEKARITALRAEKVEKNMALQRKIESLSLKTAALSTIIRLTEQELRSGSVSFLQKYKKMEEGVSQHRVGEQQHLGSGALINVAKHLGNLSFNIWNKMKEMVTYSPVVLDPNTAGYNTFVSEDLRSLGYKDEETLFLKNPERFDSYPTVLGSEGFDSGTHSWDVKVRSDVNWSVGVMGESVSRKGRIESGYWNIWFSNGKYRAYAPPSIDKVISIKKLLKKIRLTLDCNRGTLTFSDPDSKVNIYTFNQTFKERLYPLVNTVSKNPLSILPQKVTVQMET